MIGGSETLGFGGLKEGFKVHWGEGFRFLWGVEILGFGGLKVLGFSGGKDLGVIASLEGMRF